MSGKHRAPAAREHPRSPRPSSSPTVVATLVASIMAAVAIGSLALGESGAADTGAATTANPPNPMHPSSLAAAYRDCLPAVELALTMREHLAVRQPHGVLVHRRDARTGSERVLISSPAPPEPPLELATSTAMSCMLRRTHAPAGVREAVRHTGSPAARRHTTWDDVALSWSRNRGGGTEALFSVAR
jgi:hypothetical protein